jgi:hypothetical protein
MKKLICALSISLFLSSCAGLMAIREGYTTLEKDASISYATKGCWFLISDLNTNKGYAVESYVYDNKTGSIEFTPIKWDKKVLILKRREYRIQEGCPTEEPPSVIDLPTEPMPEVDPNDILMPEDLGLQLQEGSEKK